MGIISTLKKSPTAAKNLTGLVAFGGLTGESLSCYNNYRKAIDSQISEYNREAKKLAAADPGYFDAIDPWVEKQLGNAKKLKGKTSIIGPTAIGAVSMFKDKIPKGIRGSLATGLQDVN